ncbi:MAG: ABC transporter permease [Phycisphaerae bacterium]|nr:ABC transporter permease [Phycisphaerae bacterium]
MTGLIFRRLVQLPFIVLAVYTVTFVLAWALPGEAVLSDEGRQPPAEVLNALRSRYHLDDPSRFYVEYLYRASGLMWLVESAKGSAGSPPAHVFDLGPSFRYEDWSVNELVSSSLPVSMVLGLTAVALALVVGVGAGVVGALRPNSLWDVATLSVALVGISLPGFVIGTVLLLIFPVWLGIGSVGSWGRLGDMVLPAVTLSLPFAAYIARLTRMGMIEVLGADYIRTARAKGLGPGTVVLKHALKNAFLPVLSYLGPACAMAMTGSFVVERVFNVPGMGQHFVAAVKNKDLFVIMGITLIYSTMLTLFNLVTDVLYRWVDPRIG